MADVSFRIYALTHDGDFTLVIFVIKERCFMMICHYLPVVFLDWQNPVGETRIPLFN
jgi:hypothetical protein